MKRSTLWSLLLMITILLTFVACDSNDNETSSTEAPHTEHIGAGTCEVCGIDYFEELKTFIMENGTESTEISGNYFYEVNIDSSNKYNTYNTYEIAYHVRSDQIEIRNPYKSHEDWYYIIISQSGVKYGEYEWGCFGYDEGIIEGLLEASKISPDTSIILEYSSSTFESNSDSNKALQNSQRAIREMINEVLMPTIEKCEKKLSPSDFGFVRFE